MIIISSICTCGNKSTILFASAISKSPDSTMKLIPIWSADKEQPWKYTCKWHLYLDIIERKNIKIHFKKWCMNVWTLNIHRMIRYTTLGKSIMVIITSGYGNHEW